MVLFCFLDSFVICRGILILFAQGLGKCFAVGIEKVLAALLPGRFHFGRGDALVWSAFLGDGAEILAELLHRDSAKERLGHQLSGSQAGRTFGRDGTVRRAGLLFRVRRSQLPAARRWGRRRARQ